MGTHIGSGSPNRNIKTFDLLDQIVTILGTTKTHFFPLLTGIDDTRDDYELESYGEGVVVEQVLGSGDATEPFYPVQHVGGIHSVSFDAAENQYLLGADAASWSYGNGTTTDAPFSIGMFILPKDITSVDLLAKWDIEGASEDREYKLGIDGSNKLRLDLYDENANAAEIATGGTAIVLNKWQFVVATYDGVQGTSANAGISLFIDATAETETLTDSGTYVAMQAGGENPTIAASLNTNAIAAGFTGRIALPFMCGTELSAANVTTIHNLGKTLLGL